MQQECSHAQASPAQFRHDVVAVARRHEAPISQIAKDFGIPEATLHNWLKKADIEDGARPGVTQKGAAELREAKKRIRLLEQEKRDPSPGDCVLRQGCPQNEVSAGP